MDRENHLHVVAVFYTLQSGRTNTPAVVKSQKRLEYHGMALDMHAY